MNEETSTESLYQTVVNHEQQYSVWIANREPPAGWRAEGITGTKQECLAYIGHVWTDMRPRSLREKMDRDAVS
jgi:MbtH protein